MDLDRSEVRDAVNGLNEELGERLRYLGSQDQDSLARGGFLVRGLSIATDFDGTWRSGFEDFEVEGTHTQFGGGWIRFGLESAFKVFIGAGDYRAAADIAEMAPDAFTTPGLLGWRAGVKGFLEQEREVEWFDEAADYLEQDTYAAAQLRKVPSWSSINVDLWAKFFRARAAVSEIIRDPENAANQISRANGALAGTESGWVNPQVTCLRILLRVLSGVLGNDSAASISYARRELAQFAQWSGLDVNDRLAMEFVDEIEDAIAELEVEPASAMVSGLLPNALRILGRISLVGEDVAAALGPAMGRSALSLVLGQQATWMYRTLESILDEGDLRMLILRLLQASLPVYAQVRHGPIEYGKDVVAVVEREGVLVLEMYQAKVGDISKATWPKARDQLEEMFEVEMRHAQFDVEPERREGILVFNGHLNPFAEPVVEGWLREQDIDHKRHFRLMHLDAIVKWILVSDW